MPDLTPFSDLQEITAAIHRRQVSPVELIRTTLDAIARHNPSLNAYITVCDKTALAAAERLDKAIADGKEVGPLAGIPISVKDLILTKDAPTTAGSKIFGDGLPSDEDAPVIKRLRKAGAIVVGKTNMHEVALGVTSVNEHFGPVRNPWALDRIAGGSSGGSAVAVAAGLCAASVGTDTRGSIRIPASCCGITGFKPTYGLLPNELVIPLSPTLDHVGPMTRTVADAALMLGVMTGNKTLLEQFIKAMRASTKSLVIGISEYHLRDVDDAIARAIDKAIRALRPLVREVRDVSIPELEGVQEASAVITASEATAYHDVHLKRDPKAFGPLVRRRLEAGYKRSAVEYLNAVKVKRAEIGQAFAQVFSDVDVLIGATLPAPPPRLEDQMVEIGGKEADIIDAFTRLNSPQNVAGLPALSIPCGLERGIPVGLQLFAAQGRDDVVLSLGAAYQRETHWHQRRPPIAR